MRWLGGIEPSPSLFAMWLCVVLGAMILTQFTRLRGILGFTLNAAVLLCGAAAANFLARGLAGHSLDGTLLVSFAGMLACSLGMLMLFPRHRGG